MNYSGKFDAKLSDGLDAHSHAQLHVETVHATNVPAGAIIVPDAQLLFNGDFKQSGVDLVLSNDDHELVLHDYFKGEKRAALASPDGAHLTGDIVNALAGHVQYAQADGSPSVSHVIGHVTKLVGTATAIRNGVSIILNAGDNVEKGDVVQSGSNSTLGITFIDGTVFGLSSNARMVLNEMVYDPNGSNNSSLMSLVAGTITFVAGETAKHGDMKVDTPVATMGIRGTAVLTEVDFSIVGPDGLPAVRAQVLVEPDGTTGNLIMFDKLTLAPIATLNQAGQVLSMTNGNFSFSNAALSAEAQKLISDVFNLKFTDTNTKTFDHHTDIGVPQQQFAVTVTDGPSSAVAKFVNTPTANNGPSSGPPGSNPNPHIDGPPDARAFGNQFTELAGKTNDTTDPDTVSGKVNFTDPNAGDTPTVQSQKDAAGNDIVSFTYQDAHQSDITASLNPTQLADIAAVEVKLTWVPDPGNNNNGSATWTYSAPDHAFDFLAAGEILTLTYTAEVDNNYAPNPEATFKTFTVTVTGTNDAPAFAVYATQPDGTITTQFDVAPTIAFAAGKNVSGGPLLTTDATSGVLAFADVDLTDTHTVSTAMTNAVLTDSHGNPLLSGVNALMASLPGPYGLLNPALTASIGLDSDANDPNGTGTGVGTINWKLATLPVYIADFIPLGDTLTITYTVTLGDLPLGAPAGTLPMTTTTETVTVTIAGTDTAAVVWIDTTPLPANQHAALWTDGSNWETGNAPTAADDAIIITNQLQSLTQPPTPLTPTYPVAVTGSQAANSLTMNDFGTLFTNSPTLINQGTLAIGPGGINLGADSVVENNAAATITVGGLNSSTGTVTGMLEVLDESSLKNSGQLTLNAGGDFKDSSTISNTSTGKIEVAGGTLNVLVGVANAGEIIVDLPATLTLNGAAIDGGTVLDNGTLALTGSAIIKNGSLTNNNVFTVAGSGNALDGEQVANNSTLEILTGAVLTVDQNSVITNGAAGNTVQIDDNATLTLNSATITGGTVTNSGTVHVTGDSAINADTFGNNQLTIDAHQTLTLNGTAITGGTVTDNGIIHVTGDSSIDNANVNGGQATVDAGQSLKLNGTVVTGTKIVNTGTIEVDINVALHVGETLKFSGVTLTGGKISNAGTLEVTGDSSISSDTLVNNQLTIDSGETLTLNNTMVAGFLVHPGGGTTGTVSNLGTIHVTGDSSINGETWANNQLTVDGGVILTLDGTAITGGIVTDNGTVNVDATDTLTLSGVALSGGKITNAGTIEISGTGSINNDTFGNTQLTVDANQILTLDGTTVTGGIVTDTGTINVDGGSKLTLSGVALSGGKITNAGTIEITGTGSINSDTFGNTQLTVDANQILTLDGTTITGGSITDNGTVNVDATDKLTLSGVALSGGKITNAGTIEITGTGSINSDTFGNTQLTVDANQILTLDGTTVTGGIVTDTGTINVDGGSKLTLSGVALSGGKITNAGTIEITGTGSINSDTFGNTQLTVDANQILTLDGTTITGGSVTDTGTVNIDATDTLTLSGVALSGGKITNAGTIEISGTGSIDGDTFANNQLTVDANQILTLDGTTITGGAITDTGTVNVDGGSKLTLGGVALSGGKITNAGTIEITGTGSINSDTFGNTQLTVDANQILTLDGTTITGGSITDNGTVNVDATDTLTLSGVALSGGKITNAGTIEISGTGSIDGDTFGNHQLTVDANQILTLDGTTITAGILTDTGTVNVDATDKLTLSGVALSGGKITNAGTIEISGTGSINNDTFGNNQLTVDVNQILTLDGTTITGGAITDNGTVHVDGSDTLVLNGVTINGSGAVTIGTQGLVQTNGSGVTWGTNVTNDGTIEVHSGALKITGSIGGSGSVQIDAGALFELNASDTQNITYAGGSGAAGILQIDTSTFGGTITGLSSTDEIDLRTIGYALNGLHTTGTYVSNGTNTGGLLTITDGTNSISMTLVGDYRDAHFAGATDNHGGTLITLNAADDLPVFTSGEKLQTGAVTELLNTTGVSTSDSSTPAGGTIHFTDIDLTDRPTATITAQTVTWTATDGTHSTVPQLSVIENALLLQQPGNTNNGMIGWTYSVPDDTLDFLAAGETLQLVSTVTLNDNEGGTDTATVTINMTGTNDTPTISATSNAFSEASSTPLPNPTGSATPDIVSGTISFADVDLTDSHSVSITGVVASGITTGLTTDNSVLKGWMSLSGFHDATGGVTGSDTWTFTAPDDTFDYLAAGEKLILTYTAQVSDGNGGVITTPFTVTVTGTNDTPTISATSNAFSEASSTPLPNPTGSATPDIVSGTISFADVDLTDSHSVSITGVVASGITTGLTTDNSVLKGWMSLSGFHDATGGVTGSDTWTFTAPDDTFDYLAAGEKLTLTYTAQVSDGNGGVITTPFTVTVTGTNDTPTISATSNAFSEASSTPLPNPTGSTTPDIVSGTISFADVDLTDSHSVSITGVVASGITTGLTTDNSVLKGWMSLSGFHDATGGVTGSDTWTFTAPDDTFDYLAAGEKLILTYTAQVSDGNGGVITTPFTVTVTGTNDTPTISATSNAFSEASSTPLPNPTGSATPDIVSGTISFADVDLTDSHSVSITGVVASGITTGLTTDNSVLKGWMSLSGFHDATGGVTGSDTWTFTAPDDTFDYLAAGEKLILTYTAQVSDGNGGVITTPFTVTVTGTNDTPTISATSNAFSEASSTPLPNPTGSATPDIVSGTISFADVDLTDSHSVSITGVVASGITTGLTTDNSVLKGWMSLSGFHDATGGVTGSDTWTFTAPDDTFDYLAAGEKLILTYTAQVSDGNGGVITTPFTVTVTGTNDTPTISTGSVFSGTIGVPVATTGTNTLSHSAAAKLNASGLISGLPGETGFGTLALASGDDNSSGRISITSVFGAAGLDFFGTHYNSLFINNNGNVTFGAADSDYTPSTISSGVNNPMIAPFWADVDTRGQGAVYYDLDAADGIMTVTWNNVGYYDDHTNKLDSFQLVLINEGNGNFNIEYRYGKIQWTAGDASGGSNGLGGVSAHAGYSAGGGTHSFELPESGNQTELLALPTAPGNTGIAGVDEFAVRNGNVAPTSLTSTGTINFSDPDLSDTHTVQSVTYTGGGTELGTLSLTKAADTTGTGTSGQFVWTYTADFKTVRTALDSIISHAKVETFNVVISDGHGGTLSQTVSVTLDETNTDPAGVAGSAINLGLGQLGGVGEAVTIAGAPLNWTMDGAIHNADGSWTAQTNDFSTLTITPNVNFVGAAVLNVTETWTNPDGSASSILVSDNVEAYAPGSPIFAVAGDDHLTGTGTGNLFVFAQPIGNDIVYNYNAATDKIDLVGFDNIANFTDLQGNTADDANGNAVITIGNESITVNGVHAASLTASDFVFDQTPVTANPGTMQIGDGAHLSLSGGINNTGIIELNASGDETDLQLTGHGATLSGGGQVVLSDSAENSVVATNPDVTLTNVDNDISGAGQIGAGQLTLINEGTINATGANSLLIDTGANVITNSGTLEATGSGGLIVDSDVFNTGVLWANGGNVTVQGNVSGDGSALISGSATFEFAAASAENITFAPGSTGVLVLDHAFDFSGVVSGMTANTQLDLLDFSFAKGTTINYTANADGNSGILGVTDGEHTANISLSGHFDPAGFQAAVDHGTGTLISYHDAFHLA